jgi:hypothetical protein
MAATTPYGTVPPDPPKPTPKALTQRLRPLAWPSAIANLADTNERLSDGSARMAEAPAL